LESGDKEQKDAMISLNNQQKELLFDYCLGITSEEQTAQAQELVFSNEQAAKFVNSIKASLSPLESITPQECPAELAEGTIWRIKQTLRTSKVGLTELLKAEQKPKAGMWHEIFVRLATAAVFVIVGSGLITGGKVATNYARQMSWQTKCGSQMASLFNGLSNYRNDNNGQMPTMASAPGAPWWKVGDQGSENVSNTRRMWALVKNGYLKPTDFICSSYSENPAFKPFCNFICNAKDYNDFPGRKLITYSFRIGCPQGEMQKISRQVIIADMSPIFVNASAAEKELNVKLSDLLLKANSPNHGGRGQNVLFCDGSVVFTKTRYVEVSLDDIYTIQNMHTYQGVEVPASESDAFLAP
jgi:prepilin-type processing-associated H-X9-DG protein